MTDGETRVATIIRIGLLGGGWVLCYISFGWAGAMGLALLALYTAYARDGGAY